jgi:large subunit ribosomal protein L17
MALGAKRRKLGRDTGERRALFRDLVSALILHERIETTDAKAKETRRSLTVSSPLRWATTSRSTAGAAVPHRQRVLSASSVTSCPATRPVAEGTRVLRTHARGDAARMALVELVK